MQQNSKMMTFLQHSTYNQMTFHSDLDLDRNLEVTPVNYYSRN